MEKYIDKLYALLHSPIITPYNLLENAKLDNYNYVKYYKGFNGLVAEMECITEDSNEAIFYYKFNANDELITIIMKTQDNEEIMFNRDDEIKHVKERISEFIEESEQSVG